MAIVDREKVKTFLRIDHADDDELIDALISQVEAHYEHIRGIPFDTDDDGNTVYPDGSELTAALMVGYQLTANRRAGGLQSESLGDYSYTYAVGADDYPAQVIGSIRRYVRTK